MKSRALLASSSLFFASFLACSLPSSAHAEEADTSERTHVLAADVAGTALVVSSIALGPQSNVRDGLFIGGASLLVAGAPLAHAVHGHGKLAALSGVLRLGAPLVAAGASWMAYSVGCTIANPPDFRVDIDLYGRKDDTSSSRSRCSSGASWALAGAGVGLVSAVLVDALLLSAPAKTPKAPRASALNVGITPTANGLQLGVAGALP